MKKITIKDIREAINYVCQTDANHIIQNMSDEELLVCDFVKDLNIGNIRLLNVAIELQQVHGIKIPFDRLRKRPDDTIGAFLTTINEYIEEQLN